MIKNQLILLLVVCVTVFSCQPPVDKPIHTANSNKGKLYIIGGGKRPVDMVQEMVELSGVDTAGYIAVLPMSSSEPDTAFYYSKRQFTRVGIENVFNFHVDSGKVHTGSRLDSLKQAKLIYISGGTQSKFMNVVLNTPLHEAIRQAYQNGSVIAGTSAGAAVMSQKMITGNEFKHPEYTGDFRTIEANNMEIKEGLGLIEKAIIDQHFIWRMRMNRLITVAIEHPGYTCIGIDESTAIVVEGDSARVTGVSQVVVIRNPNTGVRSQDGLLAAEGMELSIYVPGDWFSLN